MFHSVYCSVLCTREHIEGTYCYRSRAYQIPTIISFGLYVASTRAYELCATSASRSVFVCVSVCKTNQHIALRVSHIKMCTSAFCRVGVVANPFIMCNARSRSRSICRTCMIFPAIFVPTSPPPLLLLLPPSRL